jgi:hypothetical protein
LRRRFKCTLVLLTYSFPSDVVKRFEPSVLRQKNLAGRQMNWNHDGNGWLHVNNSRLDAATMEFPLTIV